MISVIMSTYKEIINHLDKAIDSILSQTIQEIEFIIIVDDPTNNTLIDYIQKKAREDSRIHYFVNDKNLGLAKSLNKAIQLSSGEYIARMDADDISYLDRLESELKLLKENDLDLVGCNIVDIDEMGNILNSKGSNFPSSDKAIKLFLKTNSAIPHPTWLVKRELFFDLGMYKNFPAAQDYEFLTRVALSGKKFGNIISPKLNYRINTKGISFTKKKLQKTIQYYVRYNYIRGKETSLEDFYKFYRSKEGKKKQENLRKYYIHSEKLKNYLRKKYYIKFLVEGIFTFIFSQEARQVIYSIWREKLIKLYFGRNY